MKIIRMSQETYFVALCGQFQLPEHDVIQIDPRLHFGEIVEVPNEEPDL